MVNDQEPKGQEPGKNKDYKTRKIRKTDWQHVEKFIKDELQKRKDNEFRKNHELRWKEIDRQIAMNPMQKIGPQGKPLPPGWQSAFELGELSKASEVITADVMRIAFPQSRTWMEAHVSPPGEFQETGQQKPKWNQDQQKKADGLVRALMVQQHIDFGLRSRVESSIKEALHHGSFVATVEEETLNKVYDGSGIESLSAPTWVPHSMWNCFPDPSPRAITGSIFYPGSMMITSYMPRYKVLQLKGEGYMNIDTKKIPKKKNTNKDVETEDVEIVTYFGDLVIPRDDGDIYLPNSKCKTANGTVIYYAPNPLGFPEVIYQGYEKQDIRDPYFTSPIVKNSPIQKLATILANKFIDAVDLHTTPPVVYDGNDPYMVQNGGLNMWPGGQTASKGSNKFQEIKIGDPGAALQGLQLALTKLEEGTSVNAIRSGGRTSDRKTAHEVEKTAQGSELRTVDFVGKVEAGALRPFLYMQYEMNLKMGGSYSFYCQEKEMPDFITLKRTDLPKKVHFDVVGSKGVLGEERRAQQMSAVTAFASTNPMFAPLLNAPKILMDMYEDAGVKGAEEYVNTQGPQIPPQVQQQMQQLQQVVQQLQGELQQAKSNNEAKVMDVQLKHQERMQKMASEVDAANREFMAEQAMARAEQDLERRKAMEDASLARWQARLEAATKVEVARITAASKPEKAE